MKKIVPLLLLCAATLFAAERFSGKVTRVSDGDTFRMLREGEEVKLRLYGIDAPEREQPFGKKATNFLDSICGGKTVEAVTRKIDDEGRTHVDLLLDGKNINHLMVEYGYAWHRPKHAPDDPVLPRLQAEAQKEKRGLWSGKNPEKPWKWRDDHRSSHPKKAKK